MIKIYTVSSCTSCKKAKTWLNAHQLSYKEQNLGKEGITREELLDILTKTDNGIASIVSSKNRYAQLYKTSRLGVTPSLVCSFVLKSCEEL